MTDLYFIRNFALIAIALINTVLALAIFISNPRNKLSVAYSSFVFGLAAWTIGTIAMWNTETAQGAYYSIGATFLGGFLAVLSYLYYALLYPNRHATVQTKRVLVIFAPVPFLIVTMFTSDFFIQEILISDRGPIFSPGPAYFAYILYLITIIGYGTKVFIHKYKTLNPAHRSHVTLVCVGTLVAMGLSSLTNVFLPLFQVHFLTWLGPVFSLLILIPIGTKIMRQSLFNPKVIATQMFSALLTLVLFIDVFTAHGAVELAFKIALFLGSVAFSIILIKSVITESNESRESQRLARKMRKANKELSKLDRLKSDFISIASHQLRTPLSAVKGYTSLLIEGAFGEQAQEKKVVLSKIYKSNERLINLVNDLLDLSRLDRGNLEFILKPTDLNTILQDVIHTLETNAHNKNIKLIYEDASVPHIMLDASKFTEAVLNIVDNAIKYTERGHVRISTSAEHGMVYLSIEDTGVGLLPKERDAVFAKFQRGETARVFAEGAGLGLYIAKRIVEAHGGTIKVQSEGKGRGSTFIISLPASDSTEVKRIKPTISLVEHG